MCHAFGGATRDETLGVIDSRRQQTEAHIGTTTTQSQQHFKRSQRVQGTAQFECSNDNLECGATDVGERPGRKQGPK